MSVEKEPLRDDKQFDKILEVATRLSDNARKIVLLLRYTGMHISVLCKPKYELQEVKRNGDVYVVWKRTKKDGKEAHTEILKSKYIDFDIGEYAREVQGRKRKRSRQYFHALVRRIGLKAGLSDLSPMTFRHTLGIDMIERGVPRDAVRNILNCSERVLRTYLKYSKGRETNVLKKIGW